MADTVTNQISNKLRELIGQTQGVLVKIRGHHRALAQGPNDGDLEGELLRLIAHRDELGRELAAALVRWVALGGTVELIAAKPEPPSEEDTGLEEEDYPREKEEAPPAADDCESNTFEEMKPPAAASPEPVSAASLQALAEEGLTPNWSTNETIECPRQTSLQKVLRDIQAPAQPQAGASTQMVARLASAVERMDAWIDQPPATQRALLGLVSSMARHLQTELPHPLNYRDKDTVGMLFPKMTRWSGRYQPGFVPGLSSSKKPNTNSWLSDAKQWWEQLPTELLDSREVSPATLLRELEDRLGERLRRKELVQLVRKVVDGGVSQSDPHLVSLLLPHRNRFKSVKGFKTLKAQLKAGQAGQTTSDQNPRDYGIPDNWPLFDRTRGKVAVIVGGDDRSHASDRIKEAFGFAAIEWESGAARRAEALAERVKAGRTVDMIILLSRFISHKFSDVLVPACKETGVDLVIVDRGYGVTQVQLAMERFLGSCDPRTS